VSQNRAELPRRGRPRDAGADERIRQAAADLLLQRGFGRMTVDEVAEIAGVAKATVYRRYPSKEDLAADAMQRLFDVEVPVPDTGSIRADLEQVYADLVTFSRSEAGEAFLRLAAAECCRDTRVAALYREMLLTRLERGRILIDRAIERGEIRPDTDPEILFDWLPGLVILRVLADRPLPALEDVPALVEATLRGVARP
jgi:AcrR family transcriptional regulator